MRKSLPVMNAPSGPIRRAPTTPISSGVSPRPQQSSGGMATGEVTLLLLSTFQRLIDLLAEPIVRRAAAARHLELATDVYVRSGIVLIFM